MAFEITRDQYEALLAGQAAQREKQAVWDTRLTAVEGLVNSHHRILVIGPADGEPDLPEQVRSIGVKVDAIDGKVNKLVIQETERRENTFSRWWQLAVIVITIFLSNVLGPILRAWLGLP